MAGVKEITEGVSNVDIKTDEEGKKSEKITVFKDKKNFNTTHPLQNSWTMWYDTPVQSKRSGGRGGQDNWMDNVKQLYTFNTVEQFWSLYNNLEAVSSLVNSSNYHFFKEGITPQWEHSENMHGGKWTVSIGKTGKTLKGDTVKTLDDLWLWVMLSLIGENLDDNNDVTGAVVSVRKGHDRIAVWTKTASDEDVTMRIGRRLKDTLELKESDKFSYASHADAMKKNSSFNLKARYLV